MNAVPLRWTRNRPTRIVMRIGTMAGASRGAPAPGRRMPDIEQRQQRDDAALAALVGAHDQDGVFERDDHDQRPEARRYDARHGFGRDRAGGVRGLLEPIECAGADVAVDDAEVRQAWRRPAVARFQSGAAPPLEGFWPSLRPPKPPQGWAETPAKETSGCRLIGRWTEGVSRLRVSILIVVRGVLSPAIPPRAATATTSPIVRRCAAG